MFWKEDQILFLWKHLKLKVQQLIIEVIYVYIFLKIINKTSSVGFSYNKICVQRIVSNIFTFIYCPLVLTFKGNNGVSSIHFTYK